ncbi:MAG: hypothetical protein KKB51_23365 [Candidatus Riflebacteria bacterium]|nr:hypothetical protein [Candidatus Riflebacteria bacterium]
MNNQIENDTLTSFYNENPTAAPGEVFFEKVLDGLANRTAGYLISSLAGLFLLLGILPALYSTIKILHSAGMTDITLLESLDKAFSAGGIIMVFHTLLFLAGGIGMFYSVQWAKPVLSYAFCFTLLTALFEMRYAGLITPDAQGLVNIAILVLVVTAAYGVSRLYKKSSLTAIRTLAVLNVILSGLNVIVITKFFWNIGQFAGDRHIQYLSLMIFSLILIQTYHLGREFIPVWLSSRTSAQKDSARIE